MLVQALIFGSGFILGVRNRNHRRKLKTIKRQALAGELYQITSKSIVRQRDTDRASINQSRPDELKINPTKAPAGHRLTSSSEISLNRNIKQSIGLMGLAAIGTWLYAPLLPLTGFGTLYLCLPIFKRLSANLKKRRITTELVESASIVGFLLSGYFFLAIFSTFTSLLCMKLLARVEARSQHQLIDAFNRRSQRVWVLKEGSEIETPLENIQRGDIVVANAGEMIPVDGVVTWGLAIVDQHSLTGESQPVEKEAGVRVFAGTLVLSGRILINVEKTGADTNAAKIGQILRQTQEYKESLRLRGKQIADDFTVPTLVISGLTLPLFGPSAAMAIIWSGFGYDMRQYGPISVLNFLHIMARNGILIKDGRSLEMLQKVDTLVFDKTGTLTMEHPQLSQLHPVHPFDEDMLLTHAATAEYRQTHPIAKSILEAAKQRGLDIPDIDEAAYQVGYGIEVKTGTALIQAGSARFMRQKGIDLPRHIQQLKTRCEASSHTLVYIAVDNVLAGVVELKPRIRPEAREVIGFLKSRNISLSIISGDHEQPTRELAEELGIENYYAETLPDQKAKLVKELRDRGRFVAYIGDGINDAIALKQANVSISLSGASTVATDTAQIVLMDGDLAKLKALFKIAQSFEINMRNNYINSVLPGIITLGGVFLYGMGIAGAMGIYFTAKLIGLASTMHPLIKHRNTGGLKHINKHQSALLQYETNKATGNTRASLHTVNTHKD